jgi:hypothetical protein
MSLRDFLVANFENGAASGAKRKARNGTTRKLAKAPRTTAFASKCMDESLNGDVRTMRSNTRKAVVPPTPALTAFQAIGIHRDVPLTFGVTLAGVCLPCMRMASALLSLPCSCQESLL